jgi:hypothetical protein
MDVKEKRAGWIEQEETSIGTMSTERIDRDKEEWDSVDHEPDTSTQQLWAHHGHDPKCPRKNCY